MNEIQKKDIYDFARLFSLSNNLRNSKFLITGATGLIGSSLVHCLLALDKEIRIICPVRSLEKAQLIYEDNYKKIVYHF